MNYQLHHGDCLEIMPTLPAQSVDAIICDPPYGTTACAWDSVIPFAPMWECIRHVIKPRGAVVLFGSEPFSSLLRCSNLDWYKYDWVWRKSTGAGHLNAKNAPIKMHENISVFSNGTTANCSTQNMPYYPQGLKPCTRVRNQSRINEVIGHRPSRAGNYLQDFQNYPTTVLEYASDVDAFHPTQKPVLLLSYLIRTYTNPGDTVLDFTCGSGSTGVACAETGRNFIGIELDEAYFKIASDRIESAYRKAQGLPRQGKPTDFADMPLFQ